MFKWAPTWLERRLRASNKTVSERHSWKCQAVIGETSSYRARSAEWPRATEQRFRTWTLGGPKAVNASVGRVLHFRIESPTHREWLIAGAAVIGWLQLNGTLPSWLTEALLVVWRREDETNQHRWSKYSLSSCVKTQKKWNGDGTCGRWQLRSAPWSSRWSTWRCSPSAPCCCPRSGCGPGSPQSARGNSATRWRQSPPGQTEESF